MQPTIQVYADRDYDQFVGRLQSEFVARTNNGKEPLFTTAFDNLFELYLNAIPESERQYHNCHCCRRFVNEFGGLVTIDDHGDTHSAFWTLTDIPHELRESVKAVIDVVERAKVAGVFLSPSPVYGTAVSFDGKKNKTWHHLSIMPPGAMRFKDSLQTAHQASAEKLQDFLMVRTALIDFTKQMLEQAVKLLKTESLYRSEKLLGQAEWLLDLKTKPINLLWKAVATAPAGFCHPRSSMIGTLLEDIRSGMEFSQIEKRFAAKMHPLQYQRPQAAPSAGAIAEAEKIVEKLKAAGSLDRRFCRREEVPAIWIPHEAIEVETSEGGVFGHLKPKSSEPQVTDLRMPPISMTWEKFRRTVLPDADQIELYCDGSRNSYGALVTAANPDSPPILQWDSEENRNPVSWYLWHGGSVPAQYGLSGGRFNKIEKICLGPNQWRNEDDFAHQGQRVILLIEGAKETKMAGNALFPEIMRSEFHGIRSVIEAYARSAKIAGMESPHACGLILAKGNDTWDAHLRVTSKGLKTEYKLDRWD
jgi:hypothetical protein